MAYSTCTESTKDVHKEKNKNSIITTSYKNDKKNFLEQLFKRVTESADLVRRGLDVTTYVGNDLHLAIMAGEIRDAKNIIEVEPSQMYHRKHDDETPAYFAAKEGHLDILRMMINHFKANHDDIPSLLTNKKANKNALHEAIEHYHPGVVFWLIKHVPDLVNHLNNDKKSPLYLAAERGHSEIVKLILEIYKIDISREGKDRTILCGAARSGSVECIKYLLESNHDLLHVEDLSYRSPLAEAVYYGHVAATKALLDHGASITSRVYGSDHVGIIRDPVPNLAVEQDKYEVLELLISRCPGWMDVTDVSLRNVLHVAVLWHRMTSIELIFRRKSLAYLINQKDMNGDTPMHLLVYETFHTKKLSQEDTMKFIIDPKVDLEAINNDSKTPITCLPSHDERERLLKAMKDTHKWKINEAYISEEAQKHFKMMDQLVVVAVLITTASFAAAFTMPGGFDSNTGPDHEQGMPILLRKSHYKTFFVTNALAFICSSCVLYEYILMSLSRYSKNKILEEELDRINGRAFTMYVLTGMAMVIMAIAFITGMYVVLTPSLGFAISICSTCLVIFVSTSLFPVKFGGFVHMLMFPDAKENIKGQSPVV